ncbi:MAG: hypothetical protein KGL11_03825 [Alphaproteobacteria bacterium]|nr:hypothetical protein [Alphaproteobacteria bacterium]
MVTASLPATKSRFGASLPLLVALAAFVTVLASGPALLGDPDTYWHIVVGRWILAHRAVPHADIFSYSMAGAPWVPHEWLAETIFAPIYDHWGWSGMVLATAASFAAALAILTRALLRWLEPVHALAGTATAWGLALPHLLARPHILTLPILVLWFAALVEARERDRAPPLWLAAVMALWANLHGGYVLGLAFAALFAGEALLAARNRTARIAAVKRWGVFGAISLAAALLTPNGVAALWLPFHLMNMKFALSVLMEWQSPNFQTIQPLEIWLIVALALALGFGVKLPPARIAMLLLLLHMSLAHQRAVEVLGFIGPLLLAPPVGDFIRARSRGRQAAALDGAFADLAGRASLPGIAAVGLVAAAVALFFMQQPVVRKPDAYTPAAALKFATTHDLTGPVFNEYGFGGYLIFNGVKPFIDGRADMYGDDFIKRYIEATRGVTDDLPAMLDRFHATWTLFAAKSPAVTLMDHLPGWKRVYADDVAVIHARAGAAP